MNQRWNVLSDYLEISEMPFYWRLSGSDSAVPGISARLPIRVSVDPVYDYLKYEPNELEWDVINNAYRQNENIGFVNPESGQLQTYGTSVNNFFLKSIASTSPKTIYEIGCGAGFSIQFLKEKGWDVTGIDPSEYSLQWSQQLGFPLINDFFSENLLTQSADFVYCNDVFEHVRNIEDFCKLVHANLADEGTFCFATTNSTQSIACGDISMFEHQHVNMFTERSIYLILQDVGFSEINVKGGSYGNTLHVTARKTARGSQHELPVSDVTCQGYFARAQKKLEAFALFYQAAEDCHFYVPLRCLPYLASVGDFGDSPIYDSNQSWRGKYIDGYSQAIRSVEDIHYQANSRFFVGSLTFYSEIKKLLLGKGFSESNIFSVSEI